MRTRATEPARERPRAYKVDTGSRAAGAHPHIAGRRFAAALERPAGAGAFRRRVSELLARGRPALRKGERRSSRSRSPSGPLPVGAGPSISRAGFTLVLAPARPLVREPKTKSRLPFRPFRANRALFWVGVPACLA